MMTHSLQRQKTAACVSLATWLGMVGLASAGDLRVADTRADIERRQREVKTKHDRAVAEHKKKFEQMQRQLKADQDRLRSNLPPVASPAPSSPPRSLPLRIHTPPPPACNPASAPSPQDGLWAFVRAARSATSMEQILPYLQQREQEVLRNQQARYDPRQAAKNREWHRKQDPLISDESLNHITGPPYDWELKFHKSIANKILSVLSVKVEGNKATLRVGTKSGAVVNGEKYPYSTAEIELIGEANSWRLSRFEESIMVCKSPQEPPKP